MRATFTLAKQQIDQVPFHTKVDFGALAKWLLPQTLAFIANKMPAQKNSAGQYDAVLTLKNAIANGVGHPFDAELNKAWLNGLIKYITTNPRGDILTGRATNPDMLPYAANVPLFIAAYKKYADIPYSKWSIESLRWVVDPGLYESMICTPPVLSKEELLNLRELGTTFKSGDREGEQRNPIKATSISSTGCKEFDALPRLAKLMLTQCWICHPSFWNEYMILDPTNWDKQPEKLVVAEDIIVENENGKMPWD